VIRDEQRRILGEAAEWLATLHSGDVDDADRGRCRDWRGADPRHERAYRKMESLWRRFEGLGSDGGAATSTLNAVLGARRRQRLRGGGALAVVLLVGASASLLSLPFAPLDLLADYRSATGEQRHVALPDGSELVLNSGTAVDLDYSAGERRVRLRHGELLARVAPNRGRPFVVESAAGTARALGTEYTVRTREDGMDVVVTESSVEVCAAPPTALAAAHGRAHCAAAVAGQRARVRGDRVSAPQAVDTALETAWVKQRLVADDRPLSEVLKELRRYQSGVLHYDDKALSNIRVSGVFPLDDTDRALDLLAALAPIQVRHYTGLLTLISPR
tara:strand:+ start:17782 stop:18774 length:993 start_codon:yes stop_codon:yes gene_type:complete